MRAFGALFCLGLLALGCGSTTVHLVSPVARYDHNRTRPLCVVTVDSPAPCLPPEAESASTASAPAPMFRFRAESYAPQGATPYLLQYPHAPKTSDALPPAQLVPVFTGLPLPLSAAPVVGCESCVSDREDLVDFLASGPGVLAGVDVPDMQGDVTATRARAAAVLDRLARPDIVRKTGKELKSLFAPLDVKWADSVIDNRYAPAAVLEKAAFLWQGFWFVLHRFPGSTGFTRLVVVPTRLEQELLKKQPTPLLTEDDVMVEPGK